MFKNHLTILILFTFSLVRLNAATDEDEKLFREHLPKAKAWILTQKNIQLSKIHYSPKYRSHLSVLRLNKKVKAIDSIVYRL